MWVAEVKVNGENALIGSMAKKYQISILGYPLCFNEKKDGIYVSLAGLLYGSKENIKNFLKEEKKDPRVLKMEVRGNFIIAQIKEPLKFKPIYDSQILRLKPVMIKEDGTEHWTIGSWNKEAVVSFVNLYEKTHQAELLKLYQEKLIDVSILSM
jgi:hypothetical protein